MWGIDFFILTYKTSPTTPLNLCVSSIDIFNHAPYFPVSIHFHKEKNISEKCHFILVLVVYILSQIYYPYNLDKFLTEYHQRSVSIVLFQHYLIRVISKLMCILPRWATGVRFPGDKVIKMCSQLLF